MRKDWTFRVRFSHIWKHTMQGYIQQLNKEEEWIIRKLNMWIPHGIP